MLFLAFSSLLNFMLGGIEQNPLCKFPSFPLSLMSLFFLPSLELTRLWQYCSAETKKTYDQQNRKVKNYIDVIKKTITWAVKWQVIKSTTSSSSQHSLTCLAGEKQITDNSLFLFSPIIVQSDTMCLFAARPGLGCFKMGTKVFK